MTSANKPKTNVEPIIKAVGKPSSIAKVPPKAAPELTPIICGSTKGLWKTPCNIAPLKAKQPPTKSAITIRGKRIDQRI